MSRQAMTLAAFFNQFAFTRHKDYYAEDEIQMHHQSFGTHTWGKSEHPKSRCFYRSL